LGQCYKTFMVQFDIDLLVTLPSGVGRRDGLQRALRQAIQTGALQPGTRLPSSRVLGADLGMARGTVVDAYDQLAVEGWLTIRPASGTVVADVHLPPGTVTPPGAPAVTVARPVHDLRPGRPEAGSFPRTAWLAATRAAINRAPDSVWNDHHPLGRPELRRALAGYLGRARGVLADPDRLVICAGFTGGLELVASMLPPAAPVAVEATTLPWLRDVLHRHGHLTQPIPIDDGGAVIGALDQFDPPPAAVLVTPAHQYPYGATLVPARRHGLIRWAAHHRALVIEDDYDGEFRYNRQPIGALQALDPDRVVYGGTASKTLAPALRIGWLALPFGLADQIARRTAESTLHCTVPVTDQLTLAELINNGSYDRHVRGMRRHYHRRRDELVARLHAAVPNLIVRGSDAGLHAVLQLPSDTEEAAILAACAHHHIAVTPVHADTSPTLTDGHPAIVVGYSAPAAHAFSGAVDALVHALGEIQSGHG
jgi:GntR family transcriptional regulator / MocR family aminotransferase